MTYMLHPGQMNLSDELNPQIIQANNKSIEIFSKIQKWATGKNKFPAGMNYYRQKKYAIRRLFKVIISLYIFSVYPAKRKVIICDTTKSALEIFIGDLKLA